MKQTIVLFIMLASITVLGQKRTEKYPNGKIKSEETYKDSLKDGVCKYYFENGQLQLSAEFAKGQLVGTIKEFYDNGQKFMVIDAKTLAAKVYPQDNMSYLKGKFENTDFNMNGVWEDWYIKQKYKRFVWTFVDGYKTGPYTAFRKDGSIEATGHYLKGTLTDTLKLFDEKGVLLEMQVWKVKEDGLGSDLVNTISLSDRKSDGTPEVIDGKIYVWKNGKKELVGTIGD